MKITGRLFKTRSARGIIDLNNGGVSPSLRIATEALVPAGIAICRRKRLIASKNKKTAGLCAPGGFCFKYLSLRQSERNECRLVDCRRRGKPLVGLIGGERLSGQRPQQSVYFTCVVTHLL